MIYRIYDIGTTAYYLTPAYQQGAGQMLRARFFRMTHSSRLVLQADRQVQHTVNMRFSKSRNLCEVGLFYSMLSRYL